MIDVQRAPGYPRPSSLSTTPEALLTADGTDDELIKFEGMPKGYQLKIPPYSY